MKHKIGQAMIAGGNVFLIGISGSLEIDTITFMEAILYAILGSIVILIGFFLTDVRIEKEPHNAGNIEKLKK